jgi:predicted dehydrogenase
MSTAAREAVARQPRRPRIGFAGVGWIGAHRLEAVADDGFATIAAIADSNRSAVDAAADKANLDGQCERLDDFRTLLDMDLDGIVIATPSAAHAAQARQALAAGLAVFCQKPLARTLHEARSVVETARVNDRLLGVDFCYRHVAGVPEMRALISSGGLGAVYAVDLVFHNAYGPDKPWFFDVRQSGGGCLMDLGIHLVDLLLWCLDYPALETLHASFYRDGKRLPVPFHGVENYCAVELGLAPDITARLACSWHLPAGQDAVIEATFYGSKGSVRLKNVGGSFYDFRVEQCVGTHRSLLREPSREWGGIAIRRWARQLGEDGSFDPTAARLLDVHRLLDSMYAR